MCRYTKIAMSGWGWRESNDCRWHQGYPKDEKRLCCGGVVTHMYLIHQICINVAMTI